MKPEPPDTLIAARILGPLLLAAGEVMVFEPSRLLAMVGAVVGDDAVLLLVGFLALTFGLVILAFHRRWGSLTQVLVSLLGVVGLIRGVALLFAPEIVRAVAQDFTGSPSILLVAGAVVAAIGLWLAFVGWFTKAAA
jgi:hypothetical protein